MIDKFGSLFAGHIDLDNIGFAGTAANDRFYSNDELITVFDKTEAICTLMDDLGYDVFWMAEHHFQPEGYECIPNILQLSVHLAHLTKNIKMGCGFNIAPEVPYRGYTLKEISLVPRPINMPVECWQPIVSAGDRGLNFMAKHGIKGIIGGGAAPGGASENVVRKWQEVQAAHGNDTELGGDLILGISFFIANSPEEAIEQARPFYEENMKMFAPLGFVRGLSDDQLAALADPARAPHADLPTLESAVESGSWLVGTPEQIIEQMEDIEKRWPGLDHVNMGLPVGTPQSVILEQTEAFGKEVMPHFKNRMATAAAAGDN